MWLLFFTPTIERDEEMKLLIIDDEEGIRSSLKSLFRSEGYTLLEADDGLSGERLLREERPEVTITDIRLPGKSGLDLLETVRKEALPTETIIITGYGDVDLAVQATRAGAFDFIEKPFSPDRILLTVRNAFEKAALSQARRGTLEAELAGALIVGESSPVQALKEKIRQVAPSDATVLILGESGSGKELVAKNLHLLSRRSLQPYVHLNCAAIPEELLESELFGHRKGSFTGALHSKPGKFELAQEGTLVLDEVSELHPSLQSKLLRVLQEREVDRVGGLKPIPVDVRLIAVTNRDLRLWVKEGKFREDLFFRLNVLSLTFPPLRKRRDDLKLLAGHFTELFARENGKPDLKLSPAAWEKVMGYPWPGNVRELQNVLQRAVILADGESLQPQDLGLPEVGAVAVQEAESSDVSLAELEKRTILSTLEKNGGNRRKTAEILGISERTLRNKLKEYRVSGPEENEE